MLKAYAWHASCASSAPAHVHPDIQKLVPSERGMPAYALRLTPPLPCFRPCSVRMQKLEALKEARAAGAKRQVEEVDAAAAAAADAIADPEVERPVIQLAKKRRVSHRSLPDACLFLSAGGWSRRCSSDLQCSRPVDCAVLLCGECCWAAAVLRRPAHVRLLSPPSLPAQGGGHNGGTGGGRQQRRGRRAGR